MPRLFMASLGSTPSLPLLVVMLRLAGELTALRMKEDPEYRERAGKLLHEARQGGLISKEELIRLQAKKS